MNYCSLLSISFILLTSCSKDSNTSSPGGTVQYQINGELITVHNQGINSSESAVFIKQLAGTPLPHTLYLLQTAKAPANSFTVRILSDSLTTKNYSYDSAAVSTIGALAQLYHNGQSSAILYNGDNININITAYKNGLISGTFTAKLTPYLTNDTPEPDPALKGTILIAIVR